MSFLWKIAVLFGMWIVIGFVALCATVVKWLYRTFRDIDLEAESVDESLTEWSNTCTKRAYEFDQADKVSDRFKKIENRTGMSIWKTLFEGCVFWPKYTAITEALYQEAYEMMKEKYGMKAEKSKEAL